MFVVTTGSGRSLIPTLWWLHEKKPRAICASQHSSLITGRLSDDVVREWSHLIPVRAHAVAHQTWPESRTLLIWSVPVCVCLSAVGYWLSRALDLDNEEGLLKYQTRQALSVKTRYRMIGQGMAMWNVGKRVSELSVHFRSSFPPTVFL